MEIRLKAKAAELGFVACGFARADAAPQAGRAAARSGSPPATMARWAGWRTRAEQRASPHGLWPEARVVIALAMSYAPATDPLALADARDRGRISVYAQGADYHEMVKKALKALGRWLRRARPAASSRCSSTPRR